MSLADHADTNDGRGIIHNLERIETQLRIANLIALQKFGEAHALLFPEPPDCFCYGAGVAWNCPSHAS